MLNDKESKVLRNMEAKYYMRPIISAINLDIQQNNRTIRECFDKLYSYLTDANDAVNKLLEERQSRGEISDIKQARKSIAGAAFSNLIIWCFLKSKECGDIESDIFITPKKTDIPNWEELFLINVGDETQKPDIDLIIYSLNNDNNINKCLILSLKTSLRERAGQTYKWKLLMEIASDDSSRIKEKYNISYAPPVLPLVGFATVNFYSEINNPQHRGMFKFFDCSFIGKSSEDIGEQEFIQPLSNLIDYVNNNLR